MQIEKTKSPIDFIEWFPKYPQNSIISKKDIYSYLLSIKALFAEERDSVFDLIRISLFSEKETIDFKLSTALLRLESEYVQDTGFYFSKQDFQNMRLLFSNSSGSYADFIQYVLEVVLRQIDGIPIQDLPQGDWALARQTLFAVRQTDLGDYLVTNAHDRDMSFVPRQIPTILASFFRLSGIRPNSCKISSEKNTVTTIHSPPFDPELMPPKVVQRNVATQLRKFFNMQDASLHSYFCACASPTVYDEHALFDAEFREILFRKLLEADACAIGACVDQGLNGMARQDRDILQLSFLEALAFQGCHESDLVLMGNN
jgi:hypothetical protein